MALAHLKGNMVKSGADFELGADVKYIGIYFSAHWCPPCRGFTPALAGLYKDKFGEQTSFEIVFVSSDKDQAAFDEYFGEMPWAALKFEARGQKEELSKLYGVSGIPTLVIIDSDGNLVEKNGRALAMQKIGEDKPDPCSWSS